jgi:hypothetical protein
MHNAPSNEGLRQWNMLPGQRCNSTRVETAAAVIALMRRKSIRIGTDSAAMLSKAKALMETARRWSDEAQHDWLPKRNPLRKPWGLQNDGDLWELFFGAVLARGPRAHAFEKVKGHATQEDITAGRATAEHKLGNDDADGCATKGVEATFGGNMRTANAMRWLAKRHEDYRSFMNRVHKMIIAILKMEKTKEG